MTTDFRVEDGGASSDLAASSVRVYRADPYGGVVLDLQRHFGLRPPTGMLGEVILTADEVEILVAALRRAQKEA
jgi:hypothetical protein